MRFPAMLRASPLHTGLALVVVVQAVAALGHAVLGAPWSVWAGLATSLAIAVALSFVGQCSPRASN